MFPHQRTLVDEEEIEEERRLCYVGITRAEKHLFLTGAKMRMVFGHTVMYPPSRFLKEIPRALLTVKKKEVEQRVLHDIENRKQEKVGEMNWLIKKPTKSFVPSSAAGQGIAKFIVGDKVTHAKWGLGTIVSAKDNSDGQEVKVAFAGEGVRSLLTKYAVLKKV